VHLSHYCYLFQTVRWKHCSLHSFASFLTALKWKRHSLEFLRDSPVIFYYNCEPGCDRITGPAQLRGRVLPTHRVQRECRTDMHAAASFALSRYSYTGAAYANPDAVTQIANGLSTTTFAYDNNGNVTQKTTDGTTTTTFYPNHRARNPHPGDGLDPLLGPRIFRALRLLGSILKRFGGALGSILKGNWSCRSLDPQKKPQENSYRIYIRNSYRIYSLLVPGILESRMSQNAYRKGGDLDRTHLFRIIQGFHKR
jgi:hypothetical protein